MGCAVVEGHCRQEREGECHHLGDQTEPVDGMVAVFERAARQAFRILALSPSFARPRWMVSRRIEYTALFPSIRLTCSGSACLFHIHFY